ncbi:MAG TPA: hypothetical protein GX707_20875 [Epulopiscium sp.]|nr:hypothetical protein [Candidatus Epulonipiscium sp.]
MDKKQFDKIFDSSVQEILRSDTQEQILETISKYSNDNGKLSNEQLAIFSYVESITKSKELLYSVLSKVLDIEE